MSMERVAWSSSEELTSANKAELTTKICEKLESLLGVECDPVLAEYCLVLVGNGKTMAELRESMSEMVGETIAEGLSTWLGEQIQAMQQEAVKPPSPQKRQASPAAVKTNTNKIDASLASKRRKSSDEAPQVVVPDEEEAPAAAREEGPKLGYSRMAAQSHGSHKGKGGKGGKGGRGRATWGGKAAWGARQAWDATPAWGATQTWGAAPAWGAKGGAKGGRGRAAAPAVKHKTWVRQPSLDDALTSGRDQ